MSGTLYGVGVGPGDPELLTLKAARIIAAAPVIAYPATMAGESLARSIASGHIPADRVEIVIRIPFDPAHATEQAYDSGAAAIAGHLREDRDVACLCLGDPFFYGSFIALFARLRAEFNVEVVPGVTSLSACSAALGHPLAAGEDAFAVVPATRSEAAIAHSLRQADAAAIIKPGRHLAKIMRVLEGLGLAQQARYMERAGLPGQNVRPIQEALRDGAPYFATILVHRRGHAWKT